MSAPTVQISCSINTTDSLANLGLKILLDNQVIFETDHVKESQIFTHTMSDDEADHCLEFVMKNKTIDHTKIDEDGNILKDACIQISDLTFDDIELKQLFSDRAVYHHDFNGTQAPVNDKFYGEMGCNGTVSFKFTTPMYLWFLENM